MRKLENEDLTLMTGCRELSKREEMVRRRYVWVVCLIGPIALGCAQQAVNPSFPVDVRSAQEMIAKMQSDPKPLTRPLVILNGWLDFGIRTAYLKDVFGPATDKDQILGISFPFGWSYDNCREKVIAAVDKAFPSDDPIWTTEVDVIGISMGGLVGRYAAAEHPGCRRLRIARLYSILVPHRGAPIGNVLILDRLMRDMRPGSDFVRMLNAELPSCKYTIISYGRLGDGIVGEANTAPPGVTPWWLPNLPFQLAHIAAARDPRIQADILRRLRGEEPLTTEPPAPFPAKE